VIDYDKTSNRMMIMGPTRHGKMCWCENSALASYQLAPTDVPDRDVNTGPR
jgi:hypothetical protein